MSDSNWSRNGPLGLIALILLLFALAVGYSKERAQDSYRSNTATQDSEQPAEQFATPKAGIPAIAESFVSNPNPQESNEREKRDLAAQEGMAVWGFWMAVFAGLTAAITAAGTILIWRQVSLTREAVKDTGDATVAMVKANEIAAAAQRAWIDITPIFDIRINSNGSVRFETGAKFKNIGKSVATKVESVARLRTGPMDQIYEEYNDMFRRMIKSDSGYSLIPGGEKSGGQIYGGFTGKTVKWNEDGRSNFCLITIATYNIEGDPKRRYSRAVWRAHIANEDTADPRLTWEDFLTREIDITKNSYLDCA